ncbi:MAG: signal transduction protein, partial [Deltaproteobacteria bacterium]|nr:signal transduction protein [Deltaproteobacteria bacterium]
MTEDQLKDVTDYFGRLSTRICTDLDMAGYDFCKGNFMAMNPKWCQPLSVWKNYFSRWIIEANPQGLMEAGIFFDFNCSYGDAGLVEEVGSHIQKVVEHRPVFFHLMAENTLLFKIPLDFFGNISVESEGVNANTFNIKHVLAMIVGFARIYAIQYSLQSTNTLQRLELIHEEGVLNTSSYQEVVQSYNYLMQIRLRHQVKKINMGE